MRIAPEIAVLGAVLLAVTGVAVFAFVTLPDRYDPFAPLDVRAEPAPVVTRLKLAQVRRDRTACDAALNTSGLKIQRVAHLQQQGCALTDVVHVAPENKVFGPGFHATCPMAVGLALYMRHVVQPAARRHYGQEVVQVVHLGTFACRPVRNGRKLPEAGQPVQMSEHAAANAIDITGFRLKDGRVVAVAKHWRKAPPLQLASLDPKGVDPTASAATPDDEKAAQFLRELRDGACAIFHAVLGPDYNALHRSHFHFDMGRYRQCR
jgi:hypothetical protein